MILRVDPASPVPPYEQIRAQMATMITTGVLPPDTRLPAIRQLAGDLGLASGTVARAYRELEQGGMIETNGRRGTFVIGPEEQPRRAGGSEHLMRAARNYAVATAQLGVEAADALAAAERALQEVTTS